MARQALDVFFRSKSFSSWLWPVLKVRFFFPPKSSAISSSTGLRFFNSSPWWRTAAMPTRRSDPERFLTSWWVLWFQDFGDGSWFPKISVPENQHSHGGSGNMSPENHEQNREKGSPDPQIPADISPATGSWCRVPEEKHSGYWGPLGWAWG